MATSTSNVRVSYDAQGRRVLTHPEAATITRAELVSRAKALALVLRERARATEDLRQIPQETVDDLTNARLLSHHVAPAFGRLQARHRYAGVRSI